jgi:hypothetical protein
MNSGGDVLARGARRAQFGPAKDVSQSKWDSIFEDYIPDSEKEKVVSKSQEKRLATQTKKE